MSLKGLIASTAFTVVTACGIAAGGPVRSPLDIPLTDVLSGTAFTLSTASGRITIVEGMSVF